MTHRSESATERGEPRGGLGCTESATCPNGDAADCLGCKAPQVAPYSCMRRLRQRRSRGEMPRRRSAQAAELSRSAQPA